jgi:hypothetical protein
MNDSQASPLVFRVCDPPSMRIAVLGELGAASDEGSHVYFESLSRSYAQIGVVVERVEIRSARAGVFSIRLAAQLRKGRFDVVQYVPRNGLTNASLLRTAWLARVVPGARVYGTFLQADAAPKIGRFARGVRALVLDDAHRAALTGAGAKAWNTGVGIDSSRFSPDGPVAADLWPSGDGRKVLHVGHLRPGRNLTVISELASRGARCLVVASTSTSEDPGVTKELESAGVKVIREYIPNIGAVYRAADVYVFPVTDARSAIAVPLSVLEAIACGTQVVSTRFGALEQHLPDGATIAFVEAPDLVDSALSVPTVTRNTAQLQQWTDVALANREIFEEDRSRRPARLVVLVGVDGSGKSTQADLLARDAAARGIEATTVWARWDPLLVRPLIKLFHRSAAVSGPSVRGEFQRDLAIKRRVFRSALARRLWRAVASVDYGARTLPKLSS